jgi:hypothetical protein
LAGTRQQLLYRDFPPGSIMRGNFPRLTRQIAGLARLRARERKHIHPATFSAASVPPTEGTAANRLASKQTVSALRLGRSAPVASPKDARQCREARPTWRLAADRRSGRYFARLGTSPPGLHGQPGRRRRDARKRARREAIYAARCHFQPLSTPVEGENGKPTLTQLAKNASGANGQ